MWRQEEKCKKREYKEIKDDCEKLKSKQEGVIENMYIGLKKCQANRTRLQH